MHLYKKALGIRKNKTSAEEEPTGEIKSLDNIDVIDQSQEQLEEVAEEEVKKTSPEKNELDISVDHSEEPAVVVKSPIKADNRLNADILPTPPSDKDSPSVESDANDRLTEEITDRVLT